MPDWGRIGKYATLGAFGMSPWEMSYMDRGGYGGRQPSEAVRKGSVLVPITKPRIGAWDTGLPKPIATLGGQPAGARQVPETTMVPRREAEALHETWQEGRERGEVVDLEQLRASQGKLFALRQNDYQPGSVAHSIMTSLINANRNVPTEKVADLGGWERDFSKMRIEGMSEMATYLTGRMNEEFGKKAGMVIDASDVGLYNMGALTGRPDELGKQASTRMIEIMEEWAETGMAKPKPTPTKPEYKPGQALEKIAAAQKSKATFNKTGKIDAIMAKMFPEYTEGQKLTKSEINKVNKAYDELISHLEKFTPGAEDAEARKILEDAGMPVTPANIKYVQDQLRKSQ